MTRSTGSANPTYDFTGQVAFVTGAASGMGLSAARAFVQAGAAVVLGDVNEELLKATTDDFEATRHWAYGATSPTRIRLLRPSGGR
jgi:NAD(P)-dependent dehydrogenase (short-subunit alcohol dehydrogenase family)